MAGVARSAPLPPARDRWGGLFFLLRDIAFFARLERPLGPAAAYVDTWGVGPEVLVEAINRAVRAGAEPPALFSLAAGLVTLRDRLIDEHLAGTAIDAVAVTTEVQRLVGAVVVAG